MNLENVSRDKLKHDVASPTTLDDKTTHLTTKIPAWGWVLIVLGTFMIVAIAITVPLLLTRHKHPIITISPTLTPTATVPIIPTFPTIKSDAILFRTTIPTSDGLTKSAYQFTTIQQPRIGFLACGTSSKSAFYVLDSTTGVISSPSILISPSSITMSANSYNDFFLTTVDGTTWNKCQGDLTSATANCTTVSWPSSVSLNPVVFAGTQWTGQPTDIVFSFNPTQQITMQNENSLVCTSSNTIANTTILSTFYTVSQTYAIFGAAVGSVIIYVVYTDVTSPDCNTIYTIKVDSTGEMLRFADMTYDGLYLLVLTSERLIMYSHSTPTGLFMLQDVVNIQTTTGQCSIDRLASSSAEIWCQVTTNHNYTIIIPFVVSKKQFDLDRGRQVPVSSFFIDALGPCATHVLTNNQLVIIQSDTIGNAETVVIDLSKL